MLSFIPATAYPVVHAAGRRKRRGGKTFILAPSIPRSGNYVATHDRTQKESTTTAYARRGGAGGRLGIATVATLGIVWVGGVIHRHY